MMPTLEEARKIADRFENYGYTDPDEPFRHYQGEREQNLTKLIKECHKYDIGAATIFYFVRTGKLHHFQEES